MSATHEHPSPPLGEDLLGQAAIKATVREHYRSAVGRISRAARRLYDPEQLAALPSGAVDQALGVGNPVRCAGLAPGEVVVDLGCGGGIDTILAARAVAPTGRAIGLDMVPEMLEVAARHGAEAGLTNVEWLHGEFEAIPLPRASVDVAISNGAVNLSPRKSRVFAEVHRILRPGGRFVAADVVMDDDLPPALFTNPAAWTGCLSGALSERLLVSKLRKLGFEDVRHGAEFVFGLAEMAEYPLLAEKLLEPMRELLPPERWSHVGRSVVIMARKAASRTGGQP